MKKTLATLIKHVSKNWYFYILLVPLALLISSIADGRYYIGGDITIPIDPINNLSKLNLWHSGKESLHFLHTFWYLYYALNDYLGISSLIAQKILIIISFVAGFISTYLLHKELFEGKSYGTKPWAFLSALLFTFSPISFVLPPAYLPIYGFPVCLYLVVKSIKSTQIRYPIFFSFCLNFFFFVDLPQPKILLVFGYSTLATLLLLHQLRKIPIQVLVKKTAYLVAVSLSLNLWVLLPLALSASAGLINSFASEVPTHSGLADFGSSSLVHISRFYNYSLIENYPRLGRFLTTPLFITWSFLSWAFIAITLLLTSKKNTTFSKTIILLLSIGFPILWLAKGPNPPFGAFYIFLIKNFPLASIFRTTSSVATGFTVFYALLVSLSLYSIQTKIKKTILFSAFIIMHIVVFTPLFVGDKYYNSIYTDPTQKGFIIPSEYFSLAKTLDQLDPESTRVLPIPTTEGYAQKKWHYHGPDIISWITRADFVGSSVVQGLNDGGSDSQKQLEELGILVQSNASHILVQKDTPREPLSSLNHLGELVYSDSYFDLYQVHPNLIIDRFFSATPGVSPDISYKQITKTQYQVTIANIDQDFYLTHSEDYHQGWNLYHSPDSSFINHLKLWLNFPASPNTPQSESFHSQQNHWLVRPQQLCAVSFSSCVANEDGTYSLNLLVNFWPQQFFYISLALSVISFATILFAPLIYTSLKKKKP